MGVQDESTQVGDGVGEGEELTPKQRRSFVMKSLWHGVYVTLGLALMVACCLGVAEYLQLLHENYLWFSNLKEIEREISFRTEQGFYYSFFKQFLKSGSVFSGTNVLLNDKITEHGREINALSRFNLFPETALSWLYMFLEPATMPPTLFYADCVFGVQMVLVSAIFLASWSLAGTWLGGVLSVAFLLVNREDATRINYSVGLREGFSLPFLFAHFGLVAHYLKPRIVDGFTSFSAVVTLCLAFLSCTLAVASWQLVPFLLTVEVLGLFCLGLAGIACRRKVAKACLVVAASILAAWWLHHYPNYLLRSWGLASALIAIPCSLYPAFKPLTTSGQRFSLILNSVKFLLNLLFSAAACFALRSAAVDFFQLDPQGDDDHVRRFVVSRLSGKQNFRDLEVQLYLCNEAFDSLDEKIIGRLTENWLFPTYNFVGWLYGLSVGAGMVQRWTNKKEERADKKVVKVGEEDAKKTTTSFAFLTEARPDLAFHLGMSLAFAFLAVIMRRALCLWVPYMCLLAGAGVTDKRVWHALFDARWVKDRCSWAGDVARLAAFGGIVAVLFYKFDLKFGRELTDLREFHDPDTVNVLNWILASAPVTSVFAGSMQLMAAVKTSTGRPITNHPHFEDAWLRNRTTSQIYQIYGHRDPGEVHALLARAGATHFIVEESICTEGPSTPRASGARFCRLVDSVDLFNGHVPATMRDGSEKNKKKKKKDGVDKDGGGIELDLVKQLRLKPPKSKLFCEALDTANSVYSTLFVREYQNPSFRAYRLMSPTAAKPQK